MSDKKETDNEEIRFPCGNLEEMLRMMRKCRENGKSDCESILRRFVEQGYPNVDFSEIKKQFSGNRRKDFDLEELIKKCRKQCGR